MKEPYRPPVSLTDHRTTTHDKLAIGRCLFCFKQFRYTLKGGKCPNCESAKIHKYPKK